MATNGDDALDSEELDVEELQEVQKDFSFPSSRGMVLLDGKTGLADASFQ